MGPAGNRTRRIEEIKRLPGIGEALLGGISLFNFVEILRAVDDIFILELLRMFLARLLDIFMAVDRSMRAVIGQNRNTDIRAMVGDALEI